VFRRSQGHDERGGATAADAAQMGETMQSKGGVAEPMRKIREMLAPDGYEVVCERRSAREVTLRILALENACADCLVPKDVMLNVVNDLFSDADVRVLDVVYPANPDKHDSQA
jgi:hypothetical protein